MNTLPRATKGKRLSITAEQANAWNMAAENYGSRGKNLGSPSVSTDPYSSAIIVKVVNKTGRQLDPGYGAWLDELEDSSVVDQTRFKANDRPLFRAVFRTHVSTTRVNQLFGICLGTIQPDATGSVCIRGYCAAYISEGSAGNLAGKYAVPMVYPAHPTSPASTDFKADCCVLGRCQSTGPVEILHALGDEEDAETSQDDALYLVNLDQSLYCFRAWMQSATGGLPDLSPDAYPEVLAYQRIASHGTFWYDFPVSVLFDGFYKQFTITAASSLITALDNDGLIETSIVRVPVAGLYDVEFTGIAEALMASTGTGVTGLDTAGSVVFDTLDYFFNCVPVKTDGDEDASNAEVQHWPGAPGGGMNGASSSTYGGRLVTIPYVYSTANNSFSVPSLNAGSFHGKCRMHLKDDLRIGLRVRGRPQLAFSQSTLPDITLTVIGNLNVTPALPDLLLPIGHTVIVGTPGTSEEWDYTLASTGTLPAPGVTISSYAWKVWCPDGETETATGTSFANDYESHGDGEYVARLIVLYSDSSKGAEEFRFTLPNP